MKPFNHYFAEAKIRLSRGQSIFYDVKNALVVTAGIKIIFEINTLQSIFLAILCLMGFYLVGYIDLRWLKLFQKEQELMTSKYNPHLNKIKKLSTTKRKV